MERIEPAFVTYRRASVIVKRLALAAIAALVAVVPASGQTAADEHPYGLDPYKPRDATLLRDYGGTLVAQTPLLDLRKLDPYKPSHAALLREVGGAIPLWGILWYPGPVPASLTPFPMATSTWRPAAGETIAAQSVPASAEASPASATAAPLSATSIATLQRPENNDGMWIMFRQQKWISAGRTIAFGPSKFVRVGEYGGFPVFKRASAIEEVIYVPIREDLVAPYRLKP
jgi:hypothetical protein